MTSGEVEDIICEEMQKFWVSLKEKLHVVLVEDNLTTEDRGVFTLSRTIESFFSSPSEGEIAEIKEVALKVHFDRM